MITQFFFTISDFIKFAIPRATIKISAEAQISFKFFDFECVKVTVQLPGYLFFASKTLMGSPTILLLPTTTHFFPKVSILYLLINSIIPAGVAGIIESSPNIIFPILTG